MGGKSSPAPVQQVHTPSPAEINAQQLKNTRGLLDLQLEKMPEFTEAEIERLRSIAPESAQAVVEAQNVVLDNVQKQFPQFFQVLEGLGGEALGRLGNIGQLPSDVANQAIELSRADQAQRGIVDSPLAVAGTAGQLALLGQQQRGQDLNLASGFLNLPFAPNLPLTGVPGAGGVSSSQSLLGLQPTNALQSFGLQADVGFSNAAIQRSNALLGGQGGGFSGRGAVGGAAQGALAGSAFGPFGTIGGGIAGGAIGGFF